MLSTSIIKKILPILLLTYICGAVHANEETDLEKKMLNDCSELAKAINKSHPEIAISLQGLAPLVTWRASCAEKPPTGAGNVTALCEGERAANKGKIFFWQKLDQGKLKQGYYLCDQIGAAGLDRLSPLH